MQPNDNYSVPRRALDVDDYIDIVRRHKGWIFGPFLFALVASVVGVYLWPDTYVSQAVVKIVPQSVPENMVQSSINQQMYDRILSMQQEILSRNTLTTIIHTYDLYRREQNRMPIDDVVEDMRKKIEIVPVAPAVGGSNRAVPAFGVRFSYEDRNKAQKVVQDLVGKFLDENTRNRSNAAFQTTQFMQDEFDRAKKELDEVEGKLAAFRVANNGRLPDQVDSNMRQLSALQAQASMLESAINRATQDKLQLESNLRIYKEQLSTLKKEPLDTAVMAVQKNERLAETEREVQNWESQLTAMRQHYRDTHPDVQTAIGRLEAAKLKRDAILKEESEKKPETPAPRPVSPQVVREARDLDAAAQRLQSAIEGKDLELQQYSKEIQRTNSNIQAYQGRIETVPLGEKQYGDLVRDREIARLKYLEREEKLNRARISREMEDRKQGEMLEQLDPANLPMSPTEPKRPLVISIGAALGLVLGIVAAGAREMKDSSLKNLKDVRAYTQMAILGSIPLLENDFVVRRRKRLAWLGWTTACLAAVVISSGSIVYYYVTKV